MKTGHVMRDGNIVEVPVRLCRGVYVREGTYDDAVVKELRTYSHMDVKDKVFLDIGANIGAVSRWALDQGASKVISVEPEPNNLELLRVNARGAKIIPAAVVSKPKGKIPLYLSTTGKNPGNTSTMPFKGRTIVQVKAVGFMDLLETYRPEVLKIDCEGAEYEFLMALPSFVKQVTMEIHLNKPDWRKEQAPRIVKLFNRWKVVKEPIIGEQNWHTTGAWRR